MPELRAYALGVGELRGLAGATPARREHLRTLARQAFAPPAGSTPDRLGPLYRRVPGARVVRADEPTPADLDALLDAAPVPAARAAATWRLVEALVARLAWSGTRVADADAPPGLLVPTGLPVPAADRLVVGWCSLTTAAAVPGLAGWLAASGAWVRAAGEAGRSDPDVVVFADR